MYQLKRRFKFLEIVELTAYYETAELLVFFSKIAPLGYKLRKYEFDKKTIRSRSIFSQKEHNKYLT